MAALGTVGAVKALVYDTVFKRAQEIAASEKLRAVAFEGEYLLKGTAECIGSSPSDLYALSVSIDGTTAVGDCSCPAGKSAKSGLCKHAVALLLRRVLEVQKPRTIPQEKPPEEQVISIVSQIDDIVKNQDARKSADGREAVRSTNAQGTGPPASGSKRALPAWMLGVVGSAAGPAQPSNKPKSKKRAAESKPPRPVPPPPARRATRPGQPLKISNDTDEEEEDPGEVHDAGPIEKCPAPVVSDDDEVPETIDLPTEGAAARERRRLRALKKEIGAVAEDKGNVEVKRTGGRSSKAVDKEKSVENGNPEVRRTRGISGRVVSKEVSDQPLRVSKRRRLTKKYVEEDSDGSENEAALVDPDASNGLVLTDEDLLFLAQEQLEKDMAPGQAEDLGLEAPAEPGEKEKLAENSSQGKKSSSIFSMNEWREMSSKGRGTGGALSLAPADLDWETLKNSSLGAGSQSTSVNDRPSLNPADTSDGALQSLQTAEAAPELKDVSVPVPLATGSDDVDSVTNDMLSIFFGSSQRQVSAKTVTAASSLPSASDNIPNSCAAEVGLEARTTSCVVPTLPTIRTDLTDRGVEPKAKKKTSLKDRVKMFLG